ncbi:MAG TPA: cytochrome c peroxidase [Bryobacteraceae bacterium]|nr:cytochrome c peroxidase [Bryobacteraceae bacterium]
MKKLLAATGTLVPVVFLLAGPPPAPPKSPLGLLPLTFPADNPYSPAKVALGKVLYFDKRLSADGTVSCATCHDPKYAFTDGAPVSSGIRAQKGGRSAPTILNRAWSLAQFWDGRAATLEAQAVGPMANPIEMGNTHDAVVRTVAGLQGYKPLFKAAFGDDNVNLDRVAKAIATFERTVVSGNSPYDRWKAGQATAMSPAAVRGYHVFQKAQCDACHEGANFTSNMYSNLGVGINKPEPDLGRYLVTKSDTDWGAFKTPTLRDIEHTAPYMHDGSLKTLEDVVDYYDRGGTPNKNLDSHIKPQHLTAEQKADLVAFLKALSGTGWREITEPTSFPQ